MFQNVVDRDLIIKVTGISREATFVLPGAGVDLARFQPRPIPVGSPVVVLPARMIWDKGIGEFVAAARLVKERGHDLRFVLVGGTHESNPRAVPIHQLQAWVEEGLVEWWGRRDDMEAVYEMATVVCLPTTYGEGVPKVLLEAMAAGRPVVASDVAGCREVVEGGVTGVLVPPGDVSALATTILRVATEREFARLLAVNARRAAVDRLGVGTVVGATLRIYLDLFAADQ
jgi:glycosyltransferase involved in cell wall biosynthesis